MRYNCNSKEEQSILKYVKENPGILDEHDMEAIGSVDELKLITTAVTGRGGYKFAAPHESEEHGLYYIHGSFVVTKIKVPKELKDGTEDEKGQWRGISYFSHKASRSAI